MLGNTGEFSICIQSLQCYTANYLVGDNPDNYLSKCKVFLVPKIHSLDEKERAVKSLLLLFFNDFVWNSDNAFEVSALRIFSQ